MKWFILFAFIGVFLVKNTISSKNHKYPSRLEWLFGLNDKSKEKNKTVCQSHECKKIARILSESINKAVDPCEDFYEYACGKWSKHPVPEGMDSWGMIKSAQTNVAKQMKEIFDEGPKKNDLLAVKLAKKWYTVCMDTDAIERYGLEPLVFTLSRIGGWPLIMEPDEWNEEEYSWQKVDDQYVRLTGKNAFHDVRIVNDYDSNETEKLVHIDIPHLPSGSLKLFSAIDSEEEEDESDEDPSDEEKQSNEQQDSQEPGSEDKDDDKSGNNSNNNSEDDNDDDDDEDDDKDDDEDDDNDENDDEDDNNDDSKDDNNDDEDDAKDNDINEQNDDDNTKKKVATKKTGKFTKNKKLEHGRKMKSSTHSNKYKNKMKKEKIKKRAIPTNVNKKRIWKHKKKTLEVTTTPQISITEEPIDETDWIKQYANYISKVARALAKARGVEVAKKHMDKDIQDMIEFHLKLVEIVPIERNRSNEEKMMLDDFQEWYDKRKLKTSNSAIDWMYKIGELFDEAHVRIGGDLNLEIGSPSYFQSLGTLLDETSSRTIVNYIHWNFLSRIIRTTTSEMRNLYNAWELKEKDDDDKKDKMFGVPARTIKCIREMEMAHIVAYEYVRNNFSDEVITTISDMVDDIQKEIEYQVKKSDWMDEDTKDFILAKLVNMDKFIGYPDWYRNDTIVKQYFQGLIIGNSYYENTLSNKRYEKWKNLRTLLKNDDKDNIENLINPLIVNAFFSPYHNLIGVTAADFQSPLFAYDRPQVINYGIVGSIIGHEVNHGFDASRHLFDKNGEKVEWLKHMAEAYGKRAECFVEQFNNYLDKISDYKIENYGNLTADENIADTMGLEASFKAYKRRERECEKSDIVLPGHEDVTNDQLFFLSFANVWCEVEKNSTKTEAEYNDVHSPGRLRVIGSVSNSQNFTEAFNCPVGSAMNPEKKCHIWK